MTTLNPYQVVQDLLRDRDLMPLYSSLSTRQLREAAAMAAGMLAALGLEPEVPGEVDHPTVRRGQWLLQLLRQRDLPEGGGGFGDR